MSTTDNECISRCLDGHPDDFRLLVRRYQGALLGFLAGWVGHTDHAEEIAQETFVRAFLRLRKLRQTDVFYSWLIGIAKRVSQEHRRDEVKRRETLAPGRPEDTDQHRSHDYDLEQAIARLPEVYQKLVLLRYYGGLDCRQLATELQMPLGTVTKNLSRAYALLRESLGEQAALETQP